MLDIETTPHTVHSWGLWNQNVAISQIVEPTKMLCFAFKWLDSKETLFFRWDDGCMVEEAHKLLTEADAVITWNGDAFDLKHLNREFLLAGLGEPAPYASIDLLKTPRRKFKFASNKLDYVAQALGVGAKTSHTGFQLWLDCMAGDEKAWKLMEKYNRQDVKITEAVYKKILPWISNHPSVPLYAGSDATQCGTCGSGTLHKRGFAYTASSAFQRYQCQKCGKWLRGSKRVNSTEIRGM